MKLQPGRHFFGLGAMGYAIITLVWRQAHQFGGVFILTSSIEGNRDSAWKVAGAAYVSFSICVFSFALYQLFYLKYTAELVPKWIPPGRMFWAVATTIAFALAATGMFVGRTALLSMRLLTAMTVLFGLHVWAWPSFARPGNASNWRELVETFAIAGVSWIVADSFCQPGIVSAGWPFARTKQSLTED